MMGGRAQAPCAARATPVVMQQHAGATTKHEGVICLVETAQCVCAFAASRGVLLVLHQVQQQYRAAPTHLPPAAGPPTGASLLCFYLNATNCVVLYYACCRNTCGCLPAFANGPTPVSFVLPCDTSIRHCLSSQNVCYSGWLRSVWGIIGEPQCTAANSTGRIKERHSCSQTRMQHQRVFLLQPSRTGLAQPSPPGWQQQQAALLVVNHYPPHCWLGYVGR